MKGSMILKLAALLLAFSAISCEDPNKQEPEVDAPLLVTTTPENGASGFTDATLSVVFGFNQRIKCPAEAQQGITIDGGASIDEVVVSAAGLTVSVSGLQRGNSYTITIPEGTVQGYKANQKGSALISFHFSMRESHQGPVTPDSWEKAQAAVNNMRTGWNLGNTLDAHDSSWAGRSVSGFETGWGQPVTRPELFDMFAEAGFGAIRVPVTWNLHMGADNKVDEAWMNRVEEIVNYVLDANMYCILNVHHDTGEGGWLRADEAVYNSTKDRFTALWRQIAERFRDYGPRLLFESFNEMLDAQNRWNAPASASSYTYINKYNQDFVNAVRATGGNNSYRNLVVNDYCASSMAVAFEAMVIPDDSVQDHIIAEFHSYSPYHFAMNEGSGAIKTWTDACQKEVVDQINAMAAVARAKGVPAIIGEYGATSKRDEEEIAKQATCYVETCKANKMACFYWMLLSDGSDRNVPKWTKPLVKDAIIKAYNGK